MADDFVIESLVIEMRGDDSKYKAMLKDAESETVKSSNALKAALGKSIGDVTSALEKATTNIKAFGQATNDAAQKMGTSITQSSNKASSSLSSMNSILASIPFGLGLVVSGAMSLFRVFTSGVRDIERTDLQARRLGVSLNELKVANIWGGIAGDASVNQAIAKVQTTINQSALGLRSPTINLSSLATSSGSGMNATSFREVVQQLEKIENPAERAAHAFRLMGSSASDLLDVINSPGGFAKAEKFASQSGMLVSDADIRNAKAVTQTLRELETLWKGFLNQVVLGIAPFVRALSDMFDPKTIHLDWVKSTIFEIARGVLYFGAFLVEGAKNGQVFWDAFNLGLKLVQAGFLQLKSVALLTIKEIAQAVVTLISKTFVDFATSLGKLAGGELGGHLAKMAAILATVKITPSFKGFDEAAEEARKQSKATIREFGDDFKVLQKKVAESDSGKWVERLTEKAKKFGEEGAKAFDKLENKQIKIIDLMVKDLDKLRAVISMPGHKFVEDMVRLFRLQGEDTRVVAPFKDKGDTDRLMLISSPFQKLPKTIEEFEKIPEKLRTTVIPNADFGTIATAKSLANLIGLAGPNILKGEPGLKERIAFKSFQQLLQDTRLNPNPQLSNPVLFGSQEAASAETQFKALADRPNIQEQIKQALDIANELNKQQISIGEEVLQSLRALKGSPLLRLFDL